MWLNVLYVWQVRGWTVKFTFLNLNPTLLKVAALSFLGSLTRTAAAASLSVAVQTAPSRSVAADPCQNIIISVQKFKMANLRCNVLFIHYLGILHHWLPAR